MKFLFNIGYILICIAFFAALFVVICLLTGGLTWMLELLGCILLGVLVAIGIIIAKDIKRKKQDRPQ